MKKILVYGDSNVWGDNFITGIRIDDDKQWVNIAQKKLGKDFKLIQEGLPGRLAGANEFEKKYKNGKDTFISIFRTSSPVDMLIISLGTNDLQIKYNKNSNDIINDLLWYKKTIEEMYEDEEDRKKYFKNNKMPKILFILPCNFDFKDGASVIFNEEKDKERQKIIKYFVDNKINNIYFNNIELFDDGIHFNYEGHEKMSYKVVNVINEQIR